MTAMPFQRRWSIDVQAGVFVLVFERGLSARRAHAAAVAGELPQLVAGENRPAAVPDLPYKTVQDWCRHERARRGKVETARSSPTAVLDETLTTLIAIHRRELERARIQSSRGKQSPVLLRDLAKAGQEIARLASLMGNEDRGRSNGDGAGGKGAVQTGAGDGAKQDAGWLEQLAAETGTG